MSDHVPDIGEKVIDDSRVAVMRCAEGVVMLCPDAPVIRYNSVHLGTFFGIEVRVWKEKP